MNLGMRGLAMPTGLDIPTPNWLRDDQLGSAYAALCTLPNAHAAWARIEEKDLLVLTKGGSLVCIPVSKEEFTHLLTSGKHVLVEGVEEVCTFSLVPAKETLVMKDNGDYYLKY